MNYLKQITSIAWRNTDDKILATVSQGNDLVIWDVKQGKPVQTVHQSGHSLGVNVVNWNGIDTNKFATTQDKVVKIWDLRKFE